MFLSSISLNTEIASLGCSARTQPAMSVLYVIRPGRTPTSCISSNIWMASCGCFHTSNAGDASISFSYAWRAHDIGVTWYYSDTRPRSYKPILSAQGLQRLKSVTLDQHPAGLLAIDHKRKLPCQGSCAHRPYGVHMRTLNSLSFQCQCVTFQVSLGFLRPGSYRHKKPSSLLITVNSILETLQNLAKPSFSSVPRIFNKKIPTIFLIRWWSHQSTLAAILLKVLGIA